MNKSFLIILISSLFTINLSGQTIEDALRYAQLNSGGTARSVATGGALSAFGGDFGTLSTNPAGIASYRKSTLMFTPSYNNASTQSTFVETGFDNNRTNFGLNNIGIVFSKTSNASDWKSVNFGVGTNRLTNNNQEFFYEGTTVGTIAERWQAFANGNSPDNLYDFEEGIAYDAGILFQLPGTPADEYLIDPDGTQLLKKDQVVNRSGSVNDLNLTLGGNYRHKLYIGVTVGLPFIRYEESKTYREIDELGVSTEFNSMTFDEFFSTTGVGFNAKLGLIYRMNQKVRIGAAIHTPTFFNLTDQYYTSIESDLTLGGSQVITSSESPISNFSYSLITPWRAIGSVGFLFGKVGFISGDVEYVDYSRSQFSFDTDPLFEQDLNNELFNNLDAVINLRVGGEARYGVFAVRGGLGYSMSPYAETYTGASAGRTNVSFGIGLREKGVFLDLGVARFMYNETYTPYSLPGGGDVPSVDNSISKNQFVGTIGFRF
jgi:hypothetical protein